MSPGAEIAHTVASHGDVAQNEECRPCHRSARPRRGHRVRDAVAAVLGEGWYAAAHTTVTWLANLVRKSASSIAVSPPPTTMTSFLLEEQFVTGGAERAPH